MSSIKLFLQIFIHYYEIYENNSLYNKVYCNNVKLVTDLTKIYFKHSIPLRNSHLKQISLISSFDGQ